MMRFVLFSVLLGFLIFTPGCAPDSTDKAFLESESVGRVRFYNDDWNCITVEIRRGNKQPANQNPVIDVVNIRKGGHRDYPNTGEDYHYRREADPRCARDPVWANRFDTKAIFNIEDDVDIEVK